MSKPIENFYEYLNPNWWQLLGSNFENSLENDSVEVSFMHLNLKREGKED